jgi:uncharacterized protein YegP (UPF0339 family)
MKKASIEFYKKGWFWRWRVTAANNEIIGASSESFWRRKATEKNLELLYHAMHSHFNGGVKFIEFYKRGSTWRWRVRALNEKIIGSSSESFWRLKTAERNAELLYNALKLRFESKIDLT